MSWPLIAILSGEGDMNSYAGVGQYPTAPAEPLRERRNLIQSRESLTLALDHLHKLNGFADAMLTSFRGDTPQPARSTPETGGSLIDAFDSLAEQINASIYELAQKLESFDYFCGFGYTQAMKEQDGKICR
jgi:hypothetical protein